jgi:hypothetical protein
VGGFDGGYFLLEDDAVGAVLAHEPDVEPKGAGTVEAVRQPEERGVWIRLPDLAVQVVQNMGAVHEVDMGVAQGAWCKGSLGLPFNGRQSRKRLAADLLGQTDGLTIGHHSVIATDDTEDMSRALMDKSLLTRDVDAPSVAVGANDGLYWHLIHIEKKVLDGGFAFHDGVCSCCHWTMRWWRSW